jgi:hypothetical protein
MKPHRIRYPTIRKIIRYCYGVDSNASPALACLDNWEEGLKETFKPKIFFLPFAPAIFVIYMALSAFTVEVVADYSSEEWSRDAHMKGYFLAFALYSPIMFLVGKLSAPVLVAIRDEKRAIMTKFYRRPRKRGQYSP